MTEHPNVYLFDLDGTLLDSAPDLAAAANHLREVRGLTPLPFETLRKTASSGARGLLGAAFGIHPDDPGYAEMVKEFLDYYEAHMAEHSHLFEGVPKMIDNIKAQGASWGIITNKHARFVHPLIKFHKLEPAVVVCGDTLKVSKPNPEPILFALKSIDAKASEAIYTPGGPPVGFADFCAALQAAPTVSLACQTISPGEPVATQGFSLPLSRGSQKRSTI